MLVQCNDTNVTMSVCFTPMDGESDKTVMSDTNINCTRVLFKGINICVNTCVLYCSCMSLFDFSTDIYYKKNASVAIYCPV